MEIHTSPRPAQNQTLSPRFSLQQQKPKGGMGGWCCRGDRAQTSGWPILAETMCPMIRVMKELACFGLWAKSDLFLEPKAGGS